jgi:hypothetical protein
VSGKLSAMTYHANVGGGVDRGANNPFIVWGLIGEISIGPKLRLVREINGVSVGSKSANNSALVGFIWDAPLQNVFIDAGIRSAGQGTIAVSKMKSFQ